MQNEVIAVISESKMKDEADLH